jgi:hypothetical protein
VSPRYWLQFLLLAFVIAFFGAAFEHARLQGDRVTLGLAMLAFGYSLVVAVILQRDAHADWLCYALTGQRMPPRKPKA